MSNYSPSPAPLSDDELRETLDMVGTVLASVSDRVDAQPDPEQYGNLVGQAVAAKSPIR